MILVINAGSTSTKIALKELGKDLTSYSLHLSDSEAAIPIMDQLDLRMDQVVEFLKSHNIQSLSAIASRGGLLKPLESGIYRITSEMVEDLKEGKRGKHASNLSGLIAYRIAQDYNCPAIIADPVSVDEYEDIARISGHPEIERQALAHALNMRYVAKHYAAENGLDYASLNLITVHLGSGISVSLHKKGRLADGINSAEEGPFSPDRCGGLPARLLLDYVFSHNMTLQDAKKMVFGSGGLSAYAGTKDFRKIKEKYEQGDPKSKLIVEAMCYQVAKECGALAAAAKGQIDAVILTGGMAHDQLVTSLISSYIRFIGPIVSYPGEMEMEALAEAAEDLLSGKAEPKTYN
jgi:butyrate kinase